VEYIAEQLQESLLPSSLPEIPGVEAEVEFRPAGERHRVGGDFYDLFPGDDRSWAVLVGDMCGKGASAAAVTGLARYTLRAGAVRETRPSRTLALLNEAILRQRAPHEFCSVAFARLEPNGATGVRDRLERRPPAAARAPVGRNRGDRRRSRDAAGRRARPGLAR
jgi:serine phosphatase RsbU (regulator of sigma subunit)